MNEFLEIASGDVIEQAVLAAGIGIFSSLFLQVRSGDLEFHAIIYILLLSKCT